MHQIGQVAEAVGLSLRTIRHWEEVGLVLPSGRSAAGFRLYTDRDTERLRLLKKMKPRLEEYAAVAEERCDALRAQLDGAREITERLGAETGRPAAERRRR